jgi:hypothetical protein
MAVDIERPEAAVSDVGEHDPRRPGRADVSFTLIPLLREPAGDQSPTDEWDAKWAPRDPIAPARGVALGIALSGLM